MTLMANRRVTDGQVAVLGQQIRVKVRMGFGVPLLLCNGIGASLDVLDPLVAQLDRDTTVVRFDVPGAGGSPGSPVPYGFPYMAAVLGRLLSRLGLHGQVDVLGFSWGGALAQQFAFQNPVRCRRLILVATATGAVMVPGKPSVLAKMLSRRRFLDRDHGEAIAGELYGGAARADPSAVKRLFDRQPAICRFVQYAGDDAGRQRCGLSQGGGDVCLQWQLYHICTGAEWNDNSDNRPDPDSDKPDYSGSGSKQDRGFG